MNKRILSMVMAMLMIITCLVSPAMAASAEPQTSESLAPAAIEQPSRQTADGEILTAPAEKDHTEVEILVAVDDGETVFLQTSDLELAVESAETQLSGLYAAESSVEMALGMEIADVEYFTLVFNGFAFKGEAWMMDAINEIEGLTATIPPVFQLVEPEVEDTNIDLTPSMSTATNMVGAVNAWDLGYTGKGMVVGVIDTGIKQTHEAFSVAPEGAKIDRAYLDKVFEQYGSLMHCQNVADAYYSVKMPYNWDYFDSDHIPNHTKSNHGSHVAGIAAGNNGKDFKGVAPDAQIISLQVFTNTGSAYVSDMLSAMEDSVYLGVDAINMSLGIATGFETYQWPANFEPVYTALEKAGVAVCVAASNDAHAYIHNSYGNWYNSDWQWPAWNPDNGHLGSPGTYIGSFTVANTTNVARSSADIFYIGGKEIIPQKSNVAATPTFSGVAAGSYEIVNCGYGTPEEIAAAGDVTGKIVLAIRGGTYNNASITFGNKIVWAEQAGAMGILVYNNVPGNVNTGATGNIPYGSISMEDGQAIIAAMGEGKSTQITLDHAFSYKVATMNASSSWGTTSQLSLKPDIAAPGTNIVSADGTATKADDAYMTASGTSMATPAVAGGILLLKQYLKTIFPNATPTEHTELAYDFMMSTAGQASAFVRQQGAGVMDLEKAMKTKAYLTTTEGKRPKLAVGDSMNGEFELSFKITNYGTTDRTYGIGFNALTENTFTMEYIGNNRANKLTNLDVLRGTTYHTINPTPVTVWMVNGKTKDVTDWCTLEGDKSVTVKAGETVTVNLTLKAGEELMNYFKERCTSGMFLEGWVKLTDQSAEDKANLSIPFLGFVGDWDYPSVIDEGWWWQNEYGVNNMAMFEGSNGGRGGTYVGYGDSEQGLGLNYYWDETGETYLADRNAISPNGDGRLDSVTSIEFSLLRMPRRVYFYIRNADGTIEPLYDQTYSYRREHYYYGMSTSGMPYSGLYMDYTMDEQEENETVTLVIEAYLDHDGFELKNNKNAVLEIPFTKDTIAPVVTAIDGGVEIQDTNYVAYYAIYADARCTEKLYEDGVFAMERGVKEIYKTDLNKYFVAVADYARNEAFYYVEDGVAYELDGEGFDHGRILVGQSHAKNVSAASFASDNYYAWFTVTESLDQIPRQITDAFTGEPDDSAKLTMTSTDVIGIAKHSNGTVYASSMGFLYTMDPTTFEKTIVAQYNHPDYPPQYGMTRISIIAFSQRPGTDEVYALARLKNSWTDVWFCSVNLEDASLNLMWKLGTCLSNGYKKGFDFYDEDTILVINASNQREIVLKNYLDGSVEETRNIGLSYSGNGDGTKNSPIVGGMFGYVEPIMYDGETNSLYLSGMWSESRDKREDQIIYKQDLTTGKRKFLVAGSQGGIGLFALTFLDELIDIPEQEHICYIKETVEGSCLTEGYTLKVCAECGKEFKENLTEAKGHDYEAVVTEPTCTALGYTTYTCKVCGDSYKDNYTPNTEHKYGKWEVVTAPTCNTKGQEKRTCVCGAAEYRETDKTGHNYKAEVTAPTCTTLGYTTYTCTVCGDTYKSDFVETIGHKYSEEVVAPTCTDMGYTIFTCHCGYRYEGNFVAPTGHKFGDWEVTKEATCVEAGEETRTCACGETETRTTFKADHKYEATVVEPTCTEVGYTNHVCTVCGRNYINNLVQATGHDYEATVTEPTCTEDGYTTYICANCEDSYVDDIVPATGHTFGEWTLTTEPGCMKAGEETRYCEACDATETQEVAPVCPAEDFTDVDTKQWYHEGICYALKNGLMKGKSDTSFAPNANLTRAELVTVLYRMAGSPSVEDLNTPFTDVAADTWYTDAVIWAYNAEVVKGISETAFAPDANITREQIATILYRYAEAEAIEENALADFADAAKVSAWASDAMNWAVSVGLINGVAEDTLAPQSNATRAQIATILMRYCEG